MYNMYNKIPNSLINEFKKENVVLFIGSGLSINANLPDWENLLDQLKDQFLDRDKKEISFFESLDPNQKAQYLYDKAGKASIVNEINSIIDRNITESPLHEIAITLPVKLFITTNWDNLIEKYFDKIFKTRIKSIWKDDQISTNSRENILIKMHGTLEDPDSIVFSEEDYYQFLYRRPILEKYISAILSTSTVLFIGYSYNDFDYKLLYNYIRYKTAHLTKQPYIFIPNGDDWQANYLLKRDLKPIIFIDSVEKDKCKSSAKATEIFLKELSSKVSVTAINPIDRLLILNRENKAMIVKARNLIIRNYANLGPLATPDNPGNPALFGDEYITQLEVNCSLTWKELLDNGAHAKCIICLNKNWILERYEPGDVLERIKTLHNNLLKYDQLVEIVDIGIPTSSSLNIYGKEAFIENRKIGYRMKGYNQIIVHRNPFLINSAIDSFDKIFLEIKGVNLLDAKKLPGAQYDTTNKYIIYKIDEIINSMLRDN